jgi:hypothetical protein
MPFAYCQTDARSPLTKVGCVGVFVDGHFASFSYEELSARFDDTPPRDATVHIFELFAVLVLLRVFRHVLQHVHISVSIDNPGAAKSVETERSANIDMHVIREKIFLESFHNGCRVSGRKVVGTDIELADSLSRKDSPRFNELLYDWVKIHYPDSTTFRFDHVL